MTEKASGAVLGDRAVKMCNFLDALRLVQSGRRVRRAGWDPSLLYVARNAKLNRIELVREGRDAAGTYRFAEPYLGSAALGGPAIADYLATDWQFVQDSRVATADGGERAQAAQLAEIAREKQRGRGGVLAPRGVKRAATKFRATEEGVSRDAAGRAMNGRCDGGAF